MKMENKKLENSQIQAFAQLLMDCNPQFIFWKDIDGVYLGCNKLYANFCGLENTEQIIGTTDYKYMRKEEAEICIKADNEVIKQGNALLNFEEYVTDAHNVSRWFNINKVPLKNIEGEVLGVLGTMTDITEAKNDKKLIEEQSKVLQKSINELKIKNKELENFNFIVAHDLKEPILNISNFSNLLKSQKSYNEEYINYIIGAVDRMRSLLDALLSYFVMGDENEMVKVNLNEIVNLAIQNQLSKIQEEAVEIETSDLPSFLGYKAELVSLFQNVISNSIKYRDLSRSSKIKISSIQKGANNFQVIIEDNGIGMKQEHTELAKKIFQRLHNNKSIKGTGVGLAICTKVMHLHRGSLDIQSTLGEGTKVILNF